MVSKEAYVQKYLGIESQGHLMMQVKLPCDATPHDKINFKKTTRFSIFSGQG